MATLSALVPGVVDGVVREVIICDGGSSDKTAQIADAAGARFIQGKTGRGSQMRAGAGAAKGDWLLFLHADTVLEPGWLGEVSVFMERVDQGRRPLSAAAFKFALDDLGFMPRYLETMVRARCTLFHMAYGDQGLLIPRRLYDRLGGYQPLPLMEDVDITRRLGRRRLVMLRTRAVTSAVRYKRDGYALRMGRNLTCLALYYMRVPPRILRRIYD